VIRRRLSITRPNTATGSGGSSIRSSAVPGQEGTAPFLVPRSLLAVRNALIGVSVSSRLVEQTSAVTGACWLTGRGVFAA